jgi:hypothetical protein
MHGQERGLDHVDVVAERREMVKKKSGLPQTFKSGWGDPKKDQGFLILVVKVAAPRDIGQIP